MIKLFARKKLYDMASGIVAGKEISYSFTAPVSEERAKKEFKNAVEQGLPSGSVIIIV